MYIQESIYTTVSHPKFLFFFLSSRCRLWQQFKKKICCGQSHDMKHTHIFWRAKLHIRIHFCTCDQSCIYTYLQYTKSSYMQRWDFWGYGPTGRKGVPHFTLKGTKARLSTQYQIQMGMKMTISGRNYILVMMIFSCQAYLEFTFDNQKLTHEMYSKVFLGRSRNLLAPSFISFPPISSQFLITFFQFASLLFAFSALKEHKFL